MSTSASSSASHKPTRLGVNPRRHHVPEPERKRCKTACNQCNKRRIRCSGSQPCDQCTSAQNSCEYPAVEKKIYVSENSYNELCANAAALGMCLQKLVPDAAQRQSLVAEARQTLATGSGAVLVKDEGVESYSPAASSSTVTMSPIQAQQSNCPRKLLGDRDTAATAGKLLQDNDGTVRWLGGTSGATFLDHLKQFMRTLKSSLGCSDTGSQFLASRGQYQTSDSRLLITQATINNHLCATSDPQVVGPCLFKVDELLQGSMGTPECGGIHYLGDFSYKHWMAAQQAGHMLNPELAFYEAAFALGTIYSLTATNSRQDGQLGETYFANARQFLGDPAEVSHINMRNVATWALLAMYMLEMNRRDSAYVYLSNAITACSIFGGLKGSSRDLREKDKRIAWTLFCLTRELSCLMGRPALFHPGAFQLPPPIAVPDMPSPVGLIAHIELSRIADYIVSTTYEIAPHYKSTGDQDLVEQIGPPFQMLKDWRANLPEGLKIPFEPPADESYQVEGPHADRSLFMLHMKWNQLLILALRPLFFLAVKSAIGADFLNGDWRDLFGYDKRRELYILECSAAARRNLWLGRKINELSSIKRHSQMTSSKFVMLDLHHIFNAAVILLLHQMVNLNIVNTDNIGIIEARRIFESEARAECLGSGVTGYASDCISVLRDLSELVAQTRPLRFKDSEHVNTGVDVSWVVGASPSSSFDLTGGAADGCSTGTLGSPIAISEEQLAANLNLENPFRPDGRYYPSLGAQQPVSMNMTSYTNRAEIQSWTDLGQGNNYLPLVASYVEYTGL